MKTLILVRHAKSSWDNPGSSDFERTLNQRGENDAPFMANVLKEKGIKPDLIISSPAVRALTTAKYFATALGIEHADILQKELIYNSSFTEILKMIKKTGGTANTVMLFGHNPDITHLCTYLSGNYFDNVPTCGVICIDFTKVSKWEAIDDKNGEMRFYEYPRKYFPK